MSKHTSAGREARAVRLDSLLVAVLGFGLAGSAAADVKATLVEGFGNTDVFLNDINNKGQAVGSGVVEGTDEEHALVWHKGEAMDIGTLGGPCSAAVALDEGGVHVAGTSDVSSAPFCFSEQHAFLWRDGEMIGLGTLGGPNSFGNDVNKIGVVVGSSDTDDCEPAPWNSDFLICTQRAFRWDGHLEDLGTLGGANASGNHINNRGWVGGSSQTGAVVTIPDPFDPNITFDVEVSHATLWVDGSIHDLHPDGAPHGDSTVVAMSENGTVAITVFPYDFSQAPQSYLWKNGRHEPLDVNFVDGMNEKGEILSVGPQANGDFGPLVYGANGDVTVMQNPFDAAFPPTDMTWFCGYAMRGINNRHHAIGNGFRFFPFDGFVFEGGAVIYDYTPGKDNGKGK